MLTSTFFLIFRDRRRRRSRSLGCCTFCASRSRHYACNCVIYASINTTQSAANETNHQIARCLCTDDVFTCTVISLAPDTIQAAPASITRLRPHRFMRNADRLQYAFVQPLHREPNNASAPYGQWSHDTRMVYLLFYK